MNDAPLILDLCGGTGSWSLPYKEAGYNVAIITWPEEDVRLYPSRVNGRPRLPNEFLDITKHPKVHGMLAAPPCTVFSGSGARWGRTDHDIQQALSIVDSCVRLAFVLRPRWWAIENPVGKLKKWLGNPAFSFHPYEFGDPYTKKTHLWGEFTKPEPTHDWTFEVAINGSRMHTEYGGKSDTTKQARSVTPPGFARAFFEANP